MATTLIDTSTKYRLRGDVSKTFEVDSGYFNDLDDAGDLTDSIKDLYDSDVTISGFAAVVQRNYEVA